MKTNDIKKGMRIKMTNGYEGEMLDNQRGNIRMVHMSICPFPESGSTYAWDILSCEGQLIELTPAQIKARQGIEDAWRD